MHWSTMYGFLAALCVACSALLWGDISPGTALKTRTDFAWAIVTWGTIIFTALTILNWGVHACH